MGTTRLSLCTGVLLVVSGVALGGSAVQVDPAGAGPVNEGLRLRLAVTTAVEKGVDVHAVRVEILNVGTVPAVLVAEWPYEQDKGDYAAFLKANVEFLSFPEVEPESAQTMVGERRSPQPECMIKPGGLLAVEWSAKGRRLKAEKYFTTAPYFPTNGLYGVRAQIVVLTKGGRRVLLTSNEQPVVVGGSLQMPKYATGRVFAAFPDKKMVSINLGSDQRIGKGDQFQIRWGLAASWRVTVTEVGAGDCTGTVEGGGAVRQGVPAFPQKGWPATLIPPKENREGD